MTPTVIRVSGLSTRRGAVALVGDVDLRVGMGEVVAIVGPSGGGKTTLLRAINYLTPFTAGSVEAAGVTLRPGMDERRDAVTLRTVRQRVGMVFQQFHLFPHRTALENVMEGPRRVLGVDADEARARARHLLVRVGVGARAEAFPGSLSGGEQQRVAIARALAITPAALLLDEPTSALDRRTTADVLAVIADVAAAGQTMVIVTHELEFARRVASRIVVLAAGRIVEEGPPEDVLDRPRDAATRALVHAD